jgi:cardiolipin synthase
MILTLPTILTLARLVTLPVLLAFLYVEDVWGVWLSLFLYGLCALTDFADGWIARKFNQSSDFGRFLDPLADKIFVLLILVTMIHAGIIYGVMVFFVLLILLRELLVAGLREYTGPLNITIPVSKLAKWKTTAQMIAIGLLIISPLNGYMLFLGVLGLLIATGLTVYTGYQYFIQVWHDVFAPEGITIIDPMVVPFAAEGEIVDAPKQSRKILKKPAPVTDKKTEKKIKNKDTTKKGLASLKSKVKPEKEVATEPVVAPEEKDS